MPRNGIDWKSPDSYTRLLAALVASQDLKINYKKVADMYGEGATYDAIEGRFRIIKKEAVKLKAEVESGERPEAPARGKTPSPRKAQRTHDAVLNGRIAKSLNSTPTKKRTTTMQLKPELRDSSISMSSTNASTPSFPVSDHGSYATESFATMDLQETMAYVDAANLEASTVGPTHIEFLHSLDVWANEEDDGIA